ncbi:MAG: hypothetical protein GQ470_03735, partial [Gammaproteobacteria bacterium]|nr:hypothetical protein [Gammaproteobacteria bacterium]
HPIERAASFRNSFKRLKGVIKSVKEKRSAWLLTFDGGVKALIRKEHLEPFLDSGIHPQTLNGKSVTIRGWVHIRRGKPLIRLRDPKSIESLE